MIALREYLKRNGRKSLADAIGTAPDYLYQIATGRRRPRPAMALAIERETGGRVSRHDLLPEVWPLGAPVLPPPTKPRLSPAMQRVLTALVGGGWALTAAGPAHDHLWIALRRGGEAPPRPRPGTVARLLEMGLLREQRLRFAQWAPPCLVPTALGKRAAGEDGP